MKIPNGTDGLARLPIYTSVSNGLLNSNLRGLVIDSIYEMRRHRRTSVQLIFFMDTSVLYKIILIFLSRVLEYQSV